MSDFLVVLLESLVIGALCGFGAGAGVARMFHAPRVQGAGAFRTLGELNACENDPIAHGSFGLGFFFNAWASVVGAGALTGDVDHRIIPHWAASLSLIRQKSLESTLYNPRRMGWLGALVGAVLVAFLNSTAAAIPEDLRAVATAVLGPASEWLLNPVMPAIFWLAAMDAGRRTGAWGTVLGGLAHVVFGNAVPGIVLGIVIAKGLDDLGWSRVTRSIVTAVVLLFLCSGFLRGVDVTFLNQLGADVPVWLENLHRATGTMP
ncbi:DUF4311 domain-containing protein [Georgenia deserti]|uniref:DUF4311 domain-containing protein n=1 Tax=Georgenia deserti TaxID=2093781 RepID=A0ABW4L6L7_9MICO